MALALDGIPNLTYDQLLEHIRLSKVNAEEYTGLHTALREELEKRDPTKNYKCFKCGHTEFEEHQIRVTQGFWSAFYNLQSGRYRAVVCARCKFTEFYQGEVSIGQQTIDLLLGS
jgi:predicted nucleic-acid-binding Zn-ribbon protein